MKKKAESPLEGEYYQQVVWAGLPLPVRQYRAIPGRKFVFDFAWPDRKLLAEVDGGTWVPGLGHSSGSGIERDCEKATLAAIAGYRLMRFTTSLIRSGQALGWTEQALKAEQVFYEYGGYPGSVALVLGSHDTDEGADCGEVIMRDAVILAIIQD